MELDLMRTLVILMLMHVSVASVSVCKAGESKTLRESLYELELTHTGSDTDFPALEKQYTELMDTYSSDEDQGEILYSQLLAYANGQSVPSKTIIAAKKALAKLQDPEKRGRVYTYWGDAIQVAGGPKQGTALAEARRKAVVPYLDGIQDQIQHHIPLEKPDLPETGRKGNVIIVDPDAERAYKKKQQEIWEHYQRVKFERRMVEIRDQLIEQIAFMYERRPFDIEELEQLCYQHVADGKVCRLILAQVQRRIEHRTIEKEEAQSGHRYFLWANLGLIVILTILFVVRRLRISR